MQAAVLLAKGIAYSWTLITWRFTGVYILIAQRGQKKKSLSFVKLSNCFVRFFSTTIIPLLIDLLWVSNHLLHSQDMRLQYSVLQFGPGKHKTKEPNHLYYSKSCDLDCNIWGSKREKQLQDQFVRITTTGPETVLISLKGIWNTAHALSKATKRPRPEH